MFKLPSPVQQVELGRLSDRGVSLFVKRDDLTHPEVSGNKWRKLKYNFKEVQEKGLSPIISFGGAFSNHLAALAAAGREFNVGTFGVVRGEEADLNNPTLTAAIENGMQIRRVTRAEYRDQQKLRSRLRIEFPDAHFVAEGGANTLGVRGCMEILTEQSDHFDVIVCACGTGTTLAGLALSAKRDQKVIGIPVMKQGVQLIARTDGLLDEALEAGILRTHKHPFELANNYHFNGFGKVNNELVEFMRKFTEMNNFKLDPIYTGKMFYGIFDLIDQGRFSKDTNILAIHSGGLQGLKGITYRTGIQIYS